MNDPENSFTNPVQGPDFAAQPLAPRVARLVGVIIDGVIVMIIVFIASLILPRIGFPNPAEPGFFTNLIWLVVVLAIYVGINYKLLLSGQTIGKRLMGTRMVHLNNQLLPVPQLVAKRVLPVMLIGLVPYVGPLINLIGVLLIFRINQRCLHDLIAETKVIQAGPDPQS